MIVLAILEAEGIRAWRNGGRGPSFRAQAGLQPGGTEERLVLATGRYLGEGFDDPRLDTLFLVMPT